MNLVSPPRKIECDISGEIVGFDPTLADNIREASRFFDANLSYTDTEREQLHPLLYWSLQDDLSTPTVVVDYHEGGECRQSAAPQRSIVLNMPVSQFRNRVGRHDLMYQLLHAVNDLRLDRVMDRLGNLIREAEQDEEANRGHAH